MYGVNATASSLPTGSSRAAVRGTQRSSRAFQPHAVPATARFGGRDSNVLDRPDVEIKRSGWDADKDLYMGSPWLRPDTGNGGNGEDKEKVSPPGGGSYRVLLLDSPQHTEKGVVKALVAVIPGTDDTKARNCYATSKQLGLAIVTSCLKEHAEMYALQLHRWGCKATIEPDSSAA